MPRFVESHNEFCLVLWSTDDDVHLISSHLSFDEACRAFQNEILKDMHDEDNLLQFSDRIPEWLYHSGCNTLEEWYGWFARIPSKEAYDWYQDLIQKCEWWNCYQFGILFADPHHVDKIKNGQKALRACHVVQGCNHVLVMQ